MRAIVRHPRAFTLRDDGGRRALMRRFPYYIYFTFDESTVVVTHIVHQRRRKHRFWEATKAEA